MDTEAESTATSSLLQFLRNPNLRFQQQDAESRGGEDGSPQARRWDLAKYVEGAVARLAEERAGERPEAAPLQYKQRCRMTTISTKVHHDDTDFERQSNSVKYSVREAVQKATSGSRSELQAVCIPGCAHFLGALTEVVDSPTGKEYPQALALAGAIYSHLNDDCKDQNVDIHIESHTRPQRSAADVRLVHEPRSMIASDRFQTP